MNIASDDRTMNTTNGSMPVDEVKSEEPGLSQVWSFLLREDITQNKG